MKSIVSALVLAAGLFGFTQAQARTIIDFSEDHSGGFTNKLSPSEERQIITQVFPHYVKTSEGCDRAGGDAEFIMNEVQASRGSFSRRSAHEMIVVFFSVACTGAHVDYHGNALLVRDGHVIDARHDLATSLIRRITDIDGDGLLDAITTFSYSNMGITETTATTLTFKNGKIAERNFVSGLVHEDNCYDINPPLRMYDAVFFTNPRAPMTPIQRNYVKACGAPRSAYRHFSDGPLNPPE